MFDDNVAFLMHKLNHGMTFNAFSGVYSTLNFEMSKISTLHFNRIPIIMIIIIIMIVMVVKMM